MHALPKPSVSLLQEEADLEEQYSSLLLEKKLHLRELKRVSDEDNSRFNSHPILHNRYLLLNLLGKGGFSEVYKSFDLQVIDSVTPLWLQE